MEPTKKQIYDCFNYGLHETPTYRESILQNAYKEAVDALYEIITAQTKEGKKIAEKQGKEVLGKILGDDEDETDKTRSNTNA